MRRGRPGARCEIRKFGELPIAGQNSARVHKRWGAQGQRPIPCRPYCRKRKSKSLDGARHFENRRSALEHLVTIKRWEPPCAATSGPSSRAVVISIAFEQARPGQKFLCKACDLSKGRRGPMPASAGGSFWAPPSREGPTSVWSPRHRGFVPRPRCVCPVPYRRSLCRILIVER
jgi:hypothetical protein